MTGNQTHHKMTGTQTISQGLGIVKMRNHISIDTPIYFKMIEALWCLVFEKVKS